MNIKEITEQELRDFCLDCIAKIEAQVKERQEALDRFADCITTRSAEELLNQLKETKNETKATRIRKTERISGSENPTLQ